MSRSIRRLFAAVEAATLAAALVSSGAVFFWLRGTLLDRRLGQLRAEAAAFDAIARGWLQGYAESFTVFAAKPDAVMAALSDFDDIYEVGEDLRISRLWKRRAGSGAFAGYDLSRSGVGEWLSGLGPGRPILSAVIHAPEDGRPSVYAAERRGSTWLAGRVVLDTLMKDLRDVAQYSGTVVLVTDAEGIVLMGSSPASPPALPRGQTGPIDAGGSRWLAARLRSPALGGEIAVLEPRATLDGILAPAGLALLLLVLVQALAQAARSLVVTRRAFNPLSRLVDSIQGWSVEGRGGPGPTGSAAEGSPRAATGVAEVEALESAFVGKAGEVAEAVRRIREKDEEIRRLNESLESTVARRTAELASANAELGRTVGDLERTRDHLVLSEKMATIGRLAAGVAHDLNTPIAAIRSATGEAHGALSRAAATLPGLLAGLDPGEAALVASLASRAIATPLALELGASGRAAARERRRALGEALEAAALAAAAKDRSGEAGAGEPGAGESGGAVAARALAEDLADGLAELCLEPGPGEMDALVASPRARELALVLRELVEPARAARIGLDAAERAAQIVASLRDWSYDGGGKPRLLEVGAEMESVLALYCGRLGRGIDIRRDYLDPGWVLGSAERLAQVWVNLVDNALFAVGESGTIGVSVRKVEGVAGAEVLVEVSDDGPGIPAEIRSRVFSPFFTTKPKGKGTGLGLDQCKRIVELHGGSIDFESRPGRTVFYVRLKAARGAEEGR